MGSCYCDCCHKHEDRCDCTLVRGDAMKTVQLALLELRSLENQIYTGLKLHNAEHSWTMRKRLTEIATVLGIT